MATVKIPAPKTLNINDKSASSPWKYWKKTWERYEIATGIYETGNKKRVLSILGEDAVKVFDTFEYGDGESEQAVSAVHQRGNRGQQGQQDRKSRDTLKNPSYFKCKNCSYEHAPMKCPAFWEGVS